MPFLLENHVHMTTNTTGDKNGNPYVLTPLAGYRDFDQYLTSNGDTTWYVCYDIEDPVNYEAGLGTFNTSTGELARTEIIESSGGSADGISWNTGTRDIVCGIPASVFVKNGGSDYGILDNALPLGFVIKKSATGALVPRFEAREMRAVGDSGTPGVGTNITITQTKGATGDPTWDTVKDFADLLMRDNSAVPADRTMVEELILAALTTRITGFDTTNKDHIFRDGLSGEDMLKLIQVGGHAQEIEAWLREGGASPAWMKVLTQGNLVDESTIIKNAAGNLFDYAFSSYVGYTTATVESQTEVSIAIPAGISDYVIMVDGLGSFRDNGGDNVNHWVRLQYHTGGGFPGTTLAGAQYITHGGEDWGTGVAAGATKSCFGAISPATANTTYTFRLTGGYDSGNYWGGGNSTGGIGHHVRAFAFRKSS